MKRALSLSAAPADNTSTANADTFNRKWNTLVQKYREVIKTKLKEGSMEDIVLKACLFMKAGTQISPSITVAEDLLVDDDMMEDLDIFVDL